MAITGLPDPSSTLTALNTGSAPKPATTSDAGAKASAPPAPFTPPQADPSPTASTATSTFTAGPPRPLPVSSFPIPAIELTPLSVPADPAAVIHPRPGFEKLLKELDEAKGATPGQPADPLRANQILKDIKAFGPTPPEANVLEGRLVSRDRNNFTPGALKLLDDELKQEAIPPTPLSQRHDLVGAVSRGVVAVRNLLGVPARNVSTLSWSPPTTLVDGSALTDLAGFNIYYGTDPSNLTQKITINDPSAIAYRFTNLPAGVWYWCATAFATAEGESARAGPVSKAVK